MCFCCWLHQHHHFARWFHVWLILTQVSSSQGPSDSGFPAHFSCHLHTSPPFSSLSSCFSHDWTISWDFLFDPITRNMRSDFDDFVWREAKFWRNHWSFMNRQAHGTLLGHDHICYGYVTPIIDIFTKPINEFSTKKLNLSYLYIFSYFTFSTFCLQFEDVKHTLIKIKSRLVTFT